MSIENLLTLGVAVGLLVAAALLRLFVVGAARLFFRLSGRAIRPQEPVTETPGPSRARRPIARPALNGLGALGRGLVYALATLGTWMAATGALIGSAAAGAYASLSPRPRSGTSTVIATAWRGLKTAMIVTVASLQHLIRAASRRVEQRAHSSSRARTKPVTPKEESTEAQVIVLDREWDPLTDPLEDEPASNYR